MDTTNLFITEVDPTQVGFVQSRCGSRLSSQYGLPTTRVNDTISQEAALAFRPLLLTRRDSPITPEIVSVNTRRLTLFRNNSHTRMRAVVVPAHMEMSVVSEAATTLNFDDRPATDLGIAFYVADGIVVVTCEGRRLGWLTEYVAARQDHGFPIYGRTALPFVVENGPTWLSTGRMTLIEGQPYKTPVEVMDELVHNAENLCVGWLIKGIFTYVQKSFTGNEVWLRTLFDRDFRIDFYKTENIELKLNKDKAKIVKKAKKSESKAEKVAGSTGSLASAKETTTELKSSLSALGDTLLMDRDVMEGRKSLSLLEAIALCDAFEDLKHGEDLSQEMYFQKGIHDGTLVGDKYVFYDVQQLSDIKKIPVGGIYKVSLRKWFDMVKYEKKLKNEIAQRQIQEDEGEEWQNLSDTKDLKEGAAQIVPKTAVKRGSLLYPVICANRSCALQYMRYMPREHQHSASAQQWNSLRVLSTFEPCTLPYGCHLESKLESYELDSLLCTKMLEWLDQDYIVAACGRASEEELHNALLVHQKCTNAAKEWQYSTKRQAGLNVRRVRGAILLRIDLKVLETQSLVETALKLAQNYRGIALNWSYVFVDIDQLYVPEHVLMVGDERMGHMFCIAD